MSEVSKSELDLLEERLPSIVDNFENFTHIGSGTFSKVYVANIKANIFENYLSARQYNTFNL